MRKSQGAMAKRPKSPDLKNSNSRAIKIAGSLRPAAIFDLLGCGVWSFLPRSDMLRIGFVFLYVAAFLALVIDRVLLEIGLIDIVRAHAERLRERNEEVE